jgi:hypothetical protein
MAKINKDDDDGFILYDDEPMPPQFKTEEEYLKAREAYIKKISKEHDKMEAHKKKKGL